jgi:hypothetical protein
VLRHKHGSRYYWTLAVDLQNLPRRQMQSHRQGILGCLFDRFTNGRMREDRFRQVLHFDLLMKHGPGCGDAFRGVMSDHMHSQERPVSRFRTTFTNPSVSLIAIALPRCDRGKFPTDTGSPSALASSAVIPTVPISGNV